MISALRMCRGLPLVAVLLFCLCAPGMAQQAQQQSPPPVTAGPPDPKLVEDLVAAYRILADHNLLDGWGHVSVRHDKDPNHYLMARGMSADMVTAKDIVELDLDSGPVDAHGLPMSALFTERYIHGEIYKRRPDVMAVVHTHAPSLIPFGDTKVPLRPLYHRSAWIAFGVPVFEIRERAGMTDMLIRNAKLGQYLADALAEHPAVLMRGHGAAITAPICSASSAARSSSRSTRRCRRTR
jgi:ribulose-5-phosphate 4-epimerase/fuculose-1-phosphate aldolase